jgi:hypothetical protein
MSIQRWLKTIKLYVVDILNKWCSYWFDYLFDTLETSYNNREFSSDENKKVVKMLTNFQNTVKQNQAYNNLYKKTELNLMIQSYIDKFSERVAE